MSRRIKEMIPALVVCGALAATGLFHTWQRVDGIRLSYRLSEVTAEHQALLRSNEHLRLEVATLKAPSRIERLARENLGMLPPRPSQVTVVRMEKNERVASLDQSNKEEVLASEPRSKVPLTAITAHLGAGEEPRG